jgi:hypothetical protein
VKTQSVLTPLRSESFYSGQILSVTERPGRPPKSVPVEDLLADLPAVAAGSLPLLLRSLGKERVYAGFLALCRIAFADRAMKIKDAVLVSPPSEEREIAWQLLALTEALDRARVCWVVASNPERAAVQARKLLKIRDKADITYALDVVLLENTVDIGKLKQGFPLVVVTHPALLAHFLLDHECEFLRNRYLSNVGVIVMPSADAFPPALASTTALLMRKLNVECWRRGCHPALMATLSPACNDEAFVSELISRPIDHSAFVRDASLEQCPITVVHYSGAMVLHPHNPEKWVRQTPMQVLGAESLSRVPPGAYHGLVDFLVGDHDSFLGEQAEIHYVLDQSVSMEGTPLAKVKEAVLQDVRIKLGLLEKRRKSRTSPDYIRVSMFNDHSKEVFHEAIGPGTLERLEAVLGPIGSEGCTDLPLSVSECFERSLNSDAAVVELVLFSDGGSAIDPDVRASLLRQSAEARARGCALGLVYVVLDFEPPTEIRNLFLDMGGVVLDASIDQLHALDLQEESILGESGTGDIVLFLAGENGIPARELQGFQGGRRKLLYTRDTAKLEIEPHRVFAVVVSGRFGGEEEILNQVAHLGNGELTVFIVTEAEAWSRSQADMNLPRSGRGPAACIHAANPVLQEKWLPVLLGGIGDSPAFFWYLHEGPDHYRQMMSELKYGLRDPSYWQRPLPSGFQEGVGHRILPARQIADCSPRGEALQVPRVELFSKESTRVVGQNISLVRDAAFAPLLLHLDATVDSGDSRGRVSDHTTLPDLRLNPAGLDRIVPILTAPKVAWDRTTPNPASVRDIPGLGELEWGPVHFAGTVLGVRRYHQGNLDDDFDDERYPSPVAFGAPTRALRWKPLGQPAREVLIGLANMIRISLPALYRYPDLTLLVLPMPSQGEIWLLELAPGGNGATRILWDQPDLLKGKLRTGGWMALECPCEGGFAGATHENHDDPLDTGCPRCARVIGPVLFADPLGTEDLMRTVSKRGVIEWLYQNKHLPESTPTHLREKYEGVEDSRRVVGGSAFGTRRPFLPLVRRIFGDRLGLFLPDDAVASFAWRKKNDCLGTYDPDSNTIDMVKNLTEWFAMDVFAHEFLHNLQFRAQGFFNHAVLGYQGSENPPFGGKLFMEGAAVWAESHIVDALAIRSSLSAANLREGDEYGEGFKLMKWIEENCGGVPAVLAFLSTGNIDHATRGKVKTLPQLYAMSGINLCE